MKRATDFRVDSEAKLVDGTEILDWLRKKFKIIEERRKFFVQPLNDHVKSINAFFKTLSEPMEEADKIVSGKMLEWRKLERDRIEKEQARLNEEARKKQEKLNATAALKAEKKGVPVESIPVKEVIAPVIQQQAKFVGAGGFTKFWNYEIQDETKIPISFRMIDEQKIKYAIKNGIREIPGVRIFEDEQFRRS